MVFVPVFLIVGEHLCRKIQLDWQEWQIEELMCWIFTVLCTLLAFPKLLQSIRKLLFISSLFDIHIKMMKRE